VGLRPRQFLPMFRPLCATVQWRVCSQSHSNYRLMRIQEVDEKKPRGLSSRAAVVSLPICAFRLAWSGHHPLSKTHPHCSHVFRLISTLSNSAAVPMPVFCLQYGQMQVNVDSVYARGETNRCGSAIASLASLLIRSVEKRLAPRLKVCACLDPLRRLLWVRR